MGLKHIVGGAVAAPLLQVLIDQAYKWATNGGMSPNVFYMDPAGRVLIYYSLGDGMVTAVGAGGYIIGRRRLKPALEDFGLGALLGEAAQKIGQVLVQLSLGGYLGAPPTVNYESVPSNMIYQAKSSWTWPIYQGRNPSPVTERAEFLPFQTDLTY